MGESIAGQFLERKGYRLIEKNFRKPWGEIDIIAQDGNVVVFVEVKANARDFGGEFNPEIRVDQKKMNKITKTAALYIAYELKRMDCEWRVDIISVTIENGKAKITHFKNVAEAFQ